MVVVVVAAAVAAAVAVAVGIAAIVPPDIVDVVGGVQVHIVVVNVDIVVDDSHTCSRAVGSVWPRFCNQLKMAHGEVFSAVMGQAPSGT